MHADNLGAHLSELAYHYADAEPQKAVEYATQAANSALDRLAFEDAVNIALRGMVALERSRSDQPLPAVTEFELLITLGRRVAIRPAWTADVASSLRAGIRAR